MRSGGRLRRTGVRAAPVLLTVGAAALVAWRRRAERPVTVLALPAGTELPPSSSSAAAPHGRPQLDVLPLPGGPSPLDTELRAPAAGPGAAPPADPAMPADPRPRPRFQRTRDLALGYVSIPAVDDRHREDLRRQVRHIRRASEALELSLVDLIPDTEADDVPISERPGLRRLLRRLRRGDAACLVTTTVERLAATAEEWETLLETLERHDVRLVVVDDALDTGIDGGWAEAWALIDREAPGTR